MGHNAIIVSPTGALCQNLCWTQNVFINDLSIISSSTILQVPHTVIHQLVLHQKLKVHLKHDGDTFSLENCTFNLGDLYSLCPPNFRALGFVSVE